MGRVGRFERRLQGMVGDASARVFGGSVVPQEIKGALRREAEDQVQELAGGRQLAPNRFTVMLSPHDLDRIAGDDVERVVNDLSSAVAAHLADQGLDTFGEVVVFLERSEALHTGQFRTRSIVDPDASRRDAVRARNAGEAPMSQQPGHPEENGHYGYDRGNPGYGQQTYAPQGGYDQSRRGGYDQGEPEGYGQPGYGQPAPAGRLRPAGLRPGLRPAGAAAPAGSAGLRPPAAGRLRPAGLRPAGLRPGLRPAGAAGYGPAGLRAARVRPARLRPGLRPAGLRPAGRLPAALRPGLRRRRVRPAGLRPAAGRLGGGYQQQLTASISMDDGSGRSYQLTEGTHVIGRGQDSAFRLPDTGVSRRHFEISWDGHQATLTDLGSTNGTTVNGNPVQSWQLNDGDVDPGRALQPGLPGAVARDRSGHARPAQRGPTRSGSREEFAATCRSWCCS